MNNDHAGPRPKTRIYPYSLFLIYYCRLAFFLILYSVIIIADSLNAVQK